MQIVWARETRDDFRRFDEFLSPKNLDAAKRAVIAIRDQIEKLIDNPEIGTSLDDGSGRRELPIHFGKSGYVVRYIPDYEAEIVYILRIWHGLENR